MANLLIVDDSRVMREMIIACLRGEAELEFEQASSGLEAIEHLSMKPCDLMILDLNMPDIGGFEVLQFVRSQERLKDVPIIVVTTRGDAGSKDKALELGATRFMTKPFTPEDIVAAVRASLKGAAGAA